MPLWLRSLTIITFLCALAGLLGPLSAPGGSLAPMAADSVPGMLFFLSVMAICVLTWRWTRGGVLLLLLLQLMQVISLSGSKGPTFIARCGPVLEIVLAKGGYRVDAGLQALFADLSSSGGLTLSMSYSTIPAEMLEVATHVVGFNLLSLFFAVLLWAHIARREQSHGSARLE